MRSGSKHRRRAPRAAILSTSRSASAATISPAVPSLAAINGSAELRFASDRSARAGKRRRLLGLADADVVDQEIESCYRRISGRLSNLALGAQRNAGVNKIPPRTA